MEASKLRLNKETESSEIDNILSIQRANVQNLANENWKERKRKLQRLKKDCHGVQGRNPTGCL